MGLDGPVASLQKQCAVQLEKALALGPVLPLGWGAASINKKAPLAGLFEAQS